jgi:hypothetical protein
MRRDDRVRLAGPEDRPGTPVEVPPIDWDTPTGDLLCTSRQGFGLSRIGFPRRRRRAGGRKPWRTGGPSGRYLFIQMGAEPSDEDIFIGVMDSAELAERAARGVRALGTRAL